MDKKFIGNIFTGIGIVCFVFAVMFCVGRDYETVDGDVVEPVTAEDSGGAVITGQTNADDMWNESGPGTADILLEDEAAYYVEADVLADRVLDLQVSLMTNANARGSVYADNISLIEEAREMLAELKTMFSDTGAWTERWYLAPSGVDPQWKYYVCKDIDVGIIPVIWLCRDKTGNAVSYVYAEYDGTDKVFTNAMLNDTGYGMLQVLDGDIVPDPLTDEETGNFLSNVADMANRIRQAEMNNEFERSDYMPGYMFRDEDGNLIGDDD